MSPVAVGTHSRPTLSVRLRALMARSPLLRRITGYSAGSVIAAITSEIAFAVALGVFRVGTTWASLAGFVGGAVPNYILNRRWAWNDRRARSRRSEITRYAIVSILAFIASAVVTGAAEAWARSLAWGDEWRVLFDAAAYLAVSGLFFVAKFVVYELLVFTRGAAPGTAAGPGDDEIDMSELEVAEFD